MSARLLPHLFSPQGIGRAHPASRSRGQIPLWAAITLFAVLVVAVAIWTAFSTSEKTPDGKHQIVVWNISLMGDDIYLALHQFEQENPQYKVIASTSVSPDITGDGQRLLCAVAGGVPPDLVFFDRFAIGEWAGRGALTNLDPYLKAQSPNDPDRIDLSNYYSFTLDEARYSRPGSNQPKSLYGIPTDADIRLLWSNADQLKQAGLVDGQGNARPPKYWSELKSDAVKLTRHAPDGTITRLGFAPSYGNSWLYLYAFETGGSFLSPDGRTVTLDSPPVVKALRFMTDVYDSLGGFKMVDGFQQGFQGGLLDPFNRGQVSMKIDGDFCMTNIAQFRRDLNFIVTPAPMPDPDINPVTGQPEDVKPVTWAGGFSLVVPSSAREKDGAFKLMQFLTSHRTYKFLEEGTKESYESEGKLYLPKVNANRKFFEERVAEAVDRATDIPEPFKNAYKVIRQMLPNTKIRPPSPIGQLLWAKHNDAYNAGVNHQYAGMFKDEDQEMEKCLHDPGVEAQRGLDEVLNLPPPHVVNWTVYFFGYAALILGLLGAGAYAFKRHRRERAYSIRETGAAALFLSPWLIGMICLTAGPILFSIVMSFTRYDVLSPARYVGLENYSRLLGDEMFYKSLGNTVYMMIRIPLGMALSLVIAMLLNRKIRGIGAYRTAFYLPTVVPVVASSLLWFFLLNPSFGLLDICLRWLFATAPAHGIEWIINHLHHFSTGTFRFSPPAWLSDTRWAKPSLILMGLWGAGGGMIIWLAGLAAIPTQLYEAATVDGAGKWRQFIHVTLPMLSPYILFNAIMGVIGTMQVFGEAFIMTSGGPDNSTLFYAYHLFKTAFQFFTMGYASALAWMLFLIVLLLTLIQLYLSKKWVNYDQT